ncbi:MAG TPA: HEAT repeat domain-containing protein [bacterium]|nr:HEAT repeat domain-containing protein [bacterium]
MTRPTANRRLPPLLILTALAAACSSSPNVRTEPAIEQEQIAKKRAEQDRKRRDFQAVLIKLDQAMQSYAEALANRGEPRADAAVERIGKFLRDTVNGAEARPVGTDVKPQDYQPKEVFDRLRALATDDGNPRFRGIALAALGFSGRREVMNTLASAAMGDDVGLVDKAVFGLAILQAPDTPPGVLLSVIEREDFPHESRAQAAWALQQIQKATPNQDDIAAIWRRLLSGDTSRLPDGVLVQAVRGLGRTGDERHADLVVPLLRHPVPFVRMASAIALGRMNAQKAWPQLLELLKPRETVQNVRLHARKALAALAGDRDYGYDVAAWQKVFERGSQ